MLVLVRPMRSAQQLVTLFMYFGQGGRCKAVSSYFEESIVVRADVLLRSCTASMLNAEMQNLDVFDTHVRLRCCFSSNISRKSLPVEGENPLATDFDKPSFSKLGPGIMALRSKCIEPS
jgi:hypothetical protein